MVHDGYVEQVRLLVRVLPVVAEETRFALKGGTAINLFYRDLPRLSVDIDLTYLPIQNRAESLAEIDGAMDQIAAGIERRMKSAQVRRVAGGGGGATRILVRLGRAEIKIETSPVTRGVVHAPEIRQIGEAAQDRFGYAQIQVVSFEDLFGGKLHAAVDRQHPRDLFDVKLLYEGEGLTDALFRTFLVYVASSNRPPHELLDPNFIDLDTSYLREFAGMTREPVELEELLATRTRLIGDIKAKLDANSAKFLLSVIDATPDFAAIGLPHAVGLPAVRWKLKNLERLIEENPGKHAAQREALQRLLEDGKATY